jgi:hypothetical protein
MSDSINRRASAIRDYLDRMGEDPVIARRYSFVAARWEALRLAQDRGKTTPGEDARFLELSAVLQALTNQLGLGPGLMFGGIQGDHVGVAFRRWG